VSQNRFGLKLSLAGVAIVALLTMAFFFLSPAISSRVDKPVCIPLYAADLVCFQKPELLTTDKITAIAVGSGGRIMAVGHDQAIEIWDLQTRQRLPSLIDHTDMISAIAISADEKILASSSLDGTIKLWDLPNARLYSTLNSGRASELVFSPDSRILASSSSVKRWADGAFSPVGVQVWDVASRQRLYSVGNEPIRSMQFSSDGKLLVTGDHTKTELWQVQDGDLLKTLDSGEVTGLVFCQDGQTLITGSSRLKLWDLRNGALLRTFDAGASDLTLSPDGQTLATSAAGAVHLWHLLGERSLGSLVATTYSSLFVRFALGGQAIVAAGTDGIRIWSDPNAIEQPSS
jgi:WD40 repeat protein